MTVIAAGGGAGQYLSDYTPFIQLAKNLHWLVTRAISDLDQYQNMHRAFEVLQVRSVHCLFVTGRI
jgi:hypothetical protein